MGASSSGTPDDVCDRRSQRLLRVSRRARHALQLQRHQAVAGGEERPCDGVGAPRCPSGRDLAEDDLDRRPAVELNARSERLNVDRLAVQPDEPLAADRDFRELALDQGADPVVNRDQVVRGQDMVLVMSVNPGFGGQAFIPSALDKLRAIRARIDDSGRDIRLEINGGVKVDNIGEIAGAGADTFVAGSAIFDSDDYAATIAAMKQAVSAA